MTKKLSFTKYEHECLPAFRQRINKAESADDVRRIFVYTTRVLMEKIFEIGTEDYNGTLGSSKQRKETE